MTQQTLAAPMAGNPTAPSPRARDLVQLTLADYFSVADNEGKPIASLLVLVDSRKRPVRAELHLNGAATDDTGRIAVRQSQHIIEERYSGPDELPLQVWQSFLRSEPLHIPLGPGEDFAADDEQEGGKLGILASLWKVAAVSVIALVLLALLAGIVSRMREGEPTLAVVGPVSGGVIEQGDAIGDILIPESSLTPVEQPLPAVVVPEIELPPSRNAPADITIGRRVKIRDGAILTLRTQPGANAGDVVGYMQDGAQATVIGGPTMLKGNSDTIVWWEVQLDDGKNAWAAANDSNMTLLDLAD